MTFSEIKVHPKSDCLRIEFCLTKILDPEFLRASVVHVRTPIAHKKDIPVSKRIIIIVAKPTACRSSFTKQSSDIQLTNSVFIEEFASTKHRAKTLVLNVTIVDLANKNSKGGWGGGH